MLYERNLGVRVPLEPLKSPRLLAPSEGVQALRSGTELIDHVTVSQTSNRKKKKTAKASGLNAEWSAAEDTKLGDAVQTMKSPDWKRVAQLLGTRSHFAYQKRYEKLQVAGYRKDPLE
ncbi:hypothetical protein BCR34DRAFT_21602 [Clohesyomyces aquaticus]|uniref:Myb-like domain-containing protein n=1 Tax=Clohesyomyces aquaticus TaxID=1231657 RepID=A0A1Y2A4Z9_9PLEO|nr:hypothetical protein BCR34DRAFT_21602 [Clohesyomyces aquaticus]